MYLDDKASAEGEVVFIENRRTLMEPENWFPKPKS
ncbi:hypothetical protein ACVW0A_000526 [Pseudomonas sp. TE3610]